MSEKEEDIVLIDGDLIAFKCASVNETRSIIVKNKLTGEEETWKNRTTWRENNKDSEGFDEDNFETIKTPSTYPMVSLLLRP